MPIIQLSKDINPNLILFLRILSGLVWFATVLRRLTPNYGDFENRISGMAQGSTILPEYIMELAVQNWFLIYLLVISIEILSSISLLSGSFARGGAFLATINGFGIGMAGIGLGIVDLIIPWSVALITLFLFIFTHPGRYKGMDAYFIEGDLPQILRIFT